MTFPPTRQGTEDGQAVLDQLLGEVIRTLPGVPTQLQCRRRRRVGKAYIHLSAFCVVIAILPWPCVESLDHAMWFGFAVTLYVLGRNQIAKADRDNERACQMLGRAVRTSKPRLRLVEIFRRVK
jgi:hypothetical protein